MGRRVEFILILAIMAVFAIPYFVNFDSKSTDKVKKVNSKSSEINNFIEYDINATKLQHTLKAKSAQEVNQKWYLKEPIIITDKLKSLSSKSSVASSEVIDFYDNVVAIKSDGTVYKSNIATYNIKTKMLTTPKKFTINRHVDIVTGKDLHYDAEHKITKAKDVNGTFVLKKAKE